jgi:hypothetical protein
MTLGLQVLDMMRKMPPETRVGDLVSALDKLIIHDECRWCTKPISHMTASEDEAWYHDDSSRSRGCRAASFRVDREEGWDDSLPKTRKATPTSQRLT